MQKLKILNSKESKKILSMLEQSWGFSEKPDFVFLESSEKRIYIASRDVFSVSTENLRISSAGIYFADISKEIRLSIEGSQLIGPKSKKNIAELSDSQAEAWLSGKDIDISLPSGEFFIVRHRDDFMGTGKSTSAGKLLNFVPKERRAK